jgi:hypothetical protein
MFAGVYGVRYRGLLKQDTPKPHMDGIDEAGSNDVYDLSLQDSQSDLMGRLFINWGLGALAWAQYADRNDKPVTELRIAFQEPSFPGYLNFIQPLSRIDNIPKSWIAVLQSSRGVYLLTCPKTKEQYVGSATGEGRLLGPLASLCSHRSRRQPRTQESRPKRLSGFGPRGCRVICDNKRHTNDGRSLAVKTAKPGNGIEPKLGGSAGGPNQVMMTRETPPRPRP